jgi:hypothetical protein
VAFSFHSPFFKTVLNCSFCEAMAGSLSVASTAVSSAKFSVIGSGEFGRSVVYSRQWLGHCLWPVLQYRRQSFL